jgi:hypothetical protein
MLVASFGVIESGCGGGSNRKWVRARPKRCFVRRLGPLQATSSHLVGGKGSGSGDTKWVRAKFR